MASAYAVVAGGLILYVASVLGRLRASRRTVAALERQRDPALLDRAGPADPTTSAGRAEARE